MFNKSAVLLKLQMIMIYINNVVDVSEFVQELILTDIKTKSIAYILLEKLFELKCESTY